MALSRYTAAQMWENAVLDIQAPTFNDLQRFELINQSDDAAFSLVYGLFGNAYQRSVRLQVIAQGKYSTVAGLFQAANSSITCVALSNGSMGVGFAKTDEERDLTFRVGGMIYEVTVDKYVSPSTVIVRGNLLPSTDETVDAILMPNSILGSGIVLLTALKINRMSGALKLNLETSVKDAVVDAASLEEYKTFSPTALQNRKRIIYALENERMLLKSGMTNLGTLTLHYPGVPRPVGADSDEIDLPDGLPIK